MKDKAPKKITQMVFSIDGDSSVRFGDEINLMICGVVKSIEKTPNGKKATIAIDSISQIEGEMRQSRADVELNGMLPSHGVEWAVLKITDSIAKTPAQHALDHIMEKD